MGQTITHIRYVLIPNILNWGLNEVVGDHLNTTNRKHKKRRPGRLVIQYALYHILHQYPIWLVRYLTKFNSFFVLHKTLLRRLQSLQATQKHQAAQRPAPGVSTAASNENSLETGSEQSTTSKDDKDREDFSPKLVQQSIQRSSERLDPFLWWFRSMKIKIGRLQFVIPSGKMVLFFSLFFWMSFLLRKRGDVFRSVARKQVNSLKQAAFDALRLAFSVQMNPLAAGQQGPALPRGSW